MSPAVDVLLRAAGRHSRHESIPDPENVLRGQEGGGGKVLSPGLGPTALTLPVEPRVSHRGQHPTYPAGHRGPEEQETQAQVCKVCACLPPPRQLQQASRDSLAGTVPWPQGLVGLGKLRDCTSVPQRARVEKQRSWVTAGTGKGP